VKYNKLVKDKIPDIITRRGDKPVTRALGAAAYRRELRKKLQEEVAEFAESGEETVAISCLYCPHRRR
jgi:predicted house-cleaning noncanonical NTP pyrophosphatase (MazG superfamily)